MSKLRDDEFIKALALESFEKNAPVSIVCKDDRLLAIGKGYLKDSGFSPLSPVRNGYAKDNILAGQFVLCHFNGDVTHYRDIKKSGDEECADSAVDHPSHYNAGNIEVIDFIEDQGWGEGFNKGNAIKYIARAGIKNPSKELEDLEKGAWYLARAIKEVKGNGK